MSSAACRLWFRRALLPAGWADDVRIEISGGRIVAVQAAAAPRAGEPRHGAAVPGLCNVHSHAFQRGMAGLAEVRGPADDDFWSWREVMYRFLDRLTPDQLEAIAALAYVEMLEHGFTAVGEFHYLHHGVDGRGYANSGEMAERIAAAAAASGIGLTLLPVFYAHGGFGGAPPAPGQRRFLNDIEGFARLLEASRRAIAPLDEAGLGVAPHSLRAVTPGELDAVAALAAGGPIHIHAAEQLKEVEDCLAWSGRRPVAWLMEHQPVDARWCLIHAIHLAPEEIAGLAASGAVAGLCPVTEANLGDGIFPLPEHLAAGGRFGVGTDSNIAIAATAELRALEYAQRLVRRRRNVLAQAAGGSVGAALFAGAGRGGAQALGRGAWGLQPGASADIVALDPEHPSLTGRTGDALLDGWIFAGGAEVVEAVWRFGRLLVEHGRHKARTETERRYRRAIAELLEAPP